MSDREDNLREVSYAAEYKQGLMERKIGKKPKMMDPKYDGPNIYLVLAIMAAELAEQADHRLKNISEILKLEKKLISSQQEYDKKIKEAMRRNSDDTVKLINILKSDMETQVKQVRSGWINAFVNLKNTIKTVVRDLRTSIDNLEIKQTPPR